MKISILTAAHNEEKIIKRPLENFKKLHRFDKNIEFLIGLDGCNDKTKEKYIRRLIPNVVAGESYNELLLVQDLRTLQSTGFFEDIKRSIVPSDETGKYDLVIEIKEKRTASFGFGGGVNTVNGAFANLGFNNNNLFGEGKRISLNTQFGTGILANTIINQRFLSDRKSFQVEGRYTDNGLSLLVIHLIVL